MFETIAPILGLENATAPQVALGFAALLGLAFGALAQITRLCFRRAIDGGTGTERRAAAGAWAAALALALIGTQSAQALGWIDLSTHRFHAAEIPVLAITLGGLMFGAGMILTRGCAARLTVLAATGNLRAAAVIGLFAVIAHATMKGVLAPLRLTLAGTTLPAPTLPQNAALPLAALAAAALLAFALRSPERRRTLALAALLGLLVPAAWVGTGLLLQDDFDPIPMQALAFTAPAAEALFYTIAATAGPATFGAALIAGTLMGALASALIRREFQWQGFETPAQMGRYAAGAALMGAGGVLAGGCTIGAGLSGIPTLSAAALLALASIWAGGTATRRALLRTGQTGQTGQTEQTAQTAQTANAASSAPAAAPTTPALQPAE